MTTIPIHCPVHYHITTIYHDHHLPIHCQFHQHTTLWWSPPAPYTRMATIPKHGQIRRHTYNMMTNTIYQNDHHAYTMSSSSSRSSSRHTYTMMTTTIIYQNDHHTTVKFITTLNCHEHHHITGSPQYLYTVRFIVIPILWWPPP